MELDKKALEKATDALEFNCPTCGDGSEGRCDTCHEMVKRIVTAYEDTYHPLIESHDDLQNLQVHSAVRYADGSVYERYTDDPATHEQWMSQSGQVSVAVTGIPLPVRLVMTPNDL